MPKRLFYVSASTILLSLFASQAAVSGTLWLGNDGGGAVFQTDEAGNVIREIPSTAVTGVAFDGTYLYFSDGVGNVTRRNASGTDIGGGFGVARIGDPSEDMAWDPVRKRLWRIEHAPPSVRKIDPTNGTVELTYAIPPDDPDPNMNPRGGIGIAYDCHRDRLYLSFCRAGCSGLVRGLVLVMDPNTGGLTGELFRTDGFATGGLGYDGAADALWVGDESVIRKMSLNGAVLSSFPRPAPGGFVDGLEFIGSCELTPVTRPTWGAIKRLYYR